MKCYLKALDFVQILFSNVEWNYNLTGGSFLSPFGWVGWETARLPWEKDLGEIPQGDSPRKLASSPTGKRVVSQPALTLLW